jgi:hypothetical protein
VEKEETMSRASFLHITCMSALAFLGTPASTSRAAEKTPAELYVRTDPPGATVLVDGKDAGISPVLLDVAAGEHTIEARLVGHEPATGKVTVAEGKIGRMVLELKKLPGAAGGAAGAKVAAPPRPKATRKLFSVPRDAPILGVAFSPDARKVAAIDGQGMVMVFALPSGMQSVQVAAIKPEEKKQLQYPASEPRVRKGAVAISPDGRTLAAGVPGRGVLLLDPETLKTRREVQAANSSRSVQAAFAPTGSLLAIGTGDEKRGTFEVWEVGEPEAAAPAAGSKGF